MNSRLHAIVRGRVQGVGFRFYVLDRARELGLGGWVRNLPDGSVEVVAEGDSSSLKRLLIQCQEGPPLSVVRGVEDVWEDATGEFKEFRIEH